EQAVDAGASRWLEGTQGPGGARAEVAIVGHGMAERTQPPLHAPDVRCLPHAAGALPQHRELLIGARVRPVEAAVVLAVPPLPLRVPVMPAEETAVLVDQSGHEVIRHVDGVAESVVAR